MYWMYYALVWDCTEPLWARINANVFAFVASRGFARADFPASGGLRSTRSGVKTHRIARPVIAELLKRCLLPDQDIVDAATWLRDLVMAHGNTSAAIARSSPQGRTGKRAPDRQRQPTALAHLGRERA